MPHMIRWTIVLALAFGAAAAHAAREEIAPIPPPPPMDTNAPARLPAAPPPQDTLPPEDTLPGAAALPPDPSSAPAVSIRSEKNGDTVEEYRQNGRITMVKVTPKVGVSYTMMDTNGDGRLDRGDSNAPVAPVYYTIYEWD